MSPFSPSRKHVGTRLARRQTDYGTLVSSLNASVLSDSNRLRLLRRFFDAKSPLVTAETKSGDR